MCSAPKNTPNLTPHTPLRPFVQYFCWFSNVNFFLGHPVELDLIKLTLLYMGGGTMAFPYQAHSFNRKVWFGLVQSSCQLGHITINYQLSPRPRKFQQCLSSMQIVTKWSKNVQVDFSSYPATQHYCHLEITCASISKQQILKIARLAIWCPPSC